MFDSTCCVSGKGEHEMKVIEVKQFGGPETLQLVEETIPAPQSGQVVVDVKASGINFADIMAREGHYPSVPSVPFRPGFEIAGIVSQLGDGIRDLRVGDRVMAIVNGGGYAELAIVDAASVVKLPDGLDFGPATALLVQGLTAYFLLEAGHLQAGQTVLIPGAAGGVGSLAVQIAKLKGAGKVIGLASPLKHDLVRSLGADAVFDYTQSGWSKAVSAEAGSAGVSVFLDSQGDLGSEAFDTLGPLAYWLVFGGQSGSGNPLDANRLWGLVSKNITLRGYTLNSSAAEWGRGMSEMLNWVTTGKLRIDVESFALADAVKAHEAISGRKTTGKVVLVP
jgi:NADPH2:quinone reductase